MVGTFVGSVLPCWGSGPSWRWSCSAHCRFHDEQPSLSGKPPPAVSVARLHLAHWSSDL